MSTHANKRAETQNTSLANLSPTRQRHGRAAVQRADNRPEAAGLLKLQALANNSPQVSQLRALQQLADNSPQVSRLRALQELANNSPRTKQIAHFQTLADATVPLPVQQKIANDIGQHAKESAANDELIRAKPKTAQRQPNESDSKPRPNNTGLPDNLKSGIEALSGLSLDHVRVHYNSAQPAQLNALATAQGSDIHLAPGQEQHLPHEAWHVVQQAQGRVRPTLQLKDGVPVNDDAGLEREADVMGGRALSPVASSERHSMPASVAPLQCKTIEDLGIVGVEKEANKQELIGTDTRQVSVYKAPVAPDETREEAITSSSGVNAAIAKQIPINAKWTPKNKQLPTNQSAATLDPFILDTHGSYTSDGPKVFILRYQYAPEFRGYVTKVKDDNEAGEMANKKSTRKKEIGKYGHQHNVHSAKLLIDAANAADKDAITKIAGEGARWQCVRAHAGYLKDTTKIYVPIPKDEQNVYAVTFRELWRTWKKSFKMKYDIPDAEVAEKLREQQLKMENGAPVGIKPMTLASMDVDDYNLENPKAAKEMVYS